MHWRKGYIICFAIMLCLLGGCEKKKSNEFVENIKSSLGAESDEPETLEIMGQIVGVADNTLTIEIVEKLDGKQQPRNDIEPSNAKKDEKPDILKPLDEGKLDGPEPPELKAGFPDKKPIFQLVKMGKELSIEVKEDAEITKNSESISLEELEKDEIIYIEIRGEQVSKVRVSNQKYKVLDEIFEKGTTSTPEP